MPRQLRLEFPGACYHVMARGDRREAIFRDDQDRRAFLEVLGLACARTGWRVHAWVLMGNHYHLLLETPEPNLVAGMQWLQTTYSRRFNNRHRLWGHLFGGRYKAVLVEGGKLALPQAVASAHAQGDYFLAVADYVHLNPIRARLVKLGAGNGLLNFAWSSLAQGYAQSPARRPKWLDVATAMEAAGCADRARGRRAFVERLEARVREEGAGRAGAGLDSSQSLQSTLRRGWYFGSQGFRDHVLALAKAAGRALGRRGDAYEGAAAQREHGEAEAERLAQVGLAALGLAEVDLAQRERGDARAGLLAGLLRERTSVGLGWVAERLQFPSQAAAAQAVRRAQARGATERAIRILQRKLDELS